MNQLSLQHLCNCAMGTKKVELKINRCNTLINRCNRRTKYVYRELFCWFLLLHATFFICTQREMVRASSGLMSRRVRDLGCQIGAPGLHIMGGILGRIFNSHSEDHKKSPFLAETRLANPNFAISRFPHGEKGSETIKE